MGVGSCNSHGIARRSSVNMPSTMKTVMVAVVLLSASHTADAERGCRLGTQPVFTHLGIPDDATENVAQPATAFCNACGSGALGTGAPAFDSLQGGTNIDVSAVDALRTAVAMTNAMNEACPTVIYTTGTAGDQPFLTRPVVSTTNAGVTAQMVPMHATNVYAANQIGAGNFPLIPCAAPNSNICPLCTCTDLGAPSSAPTTAPTFPTAAPTVADSTTESINLSDDALSAGDIAGIVIGAVGGSFLFLLVGVLVGGMIGGKSSGAAAPPAGQL